jgi:hypothetical protein
MLSSPGFRVSVKGLSVDDFSVDTELFTYSPLEAVMKLKKLSANDTVFAQGGRTFFSLGSLNVDMAYSKGKPPLPGSISFKNFFMDTRVFGSSSVSRSEYRISNFELKNKLSGDIFNSSLSIDGPNLFTIKSSFALSFPDWFLESDNMADLFQMDYGSDAMLNSLDFSYTDRSFLDLVLEMAGMPGGRENAANQLNDMLMLFAMIGGVDAERFAREASSFVARPGKFELKANLESPLSYWEISQNPFAVNLSLTINGGRPFTIDGH